MLEVNTLRVSEFRFLEKCAALRVSDLRLSFGGSLCSTPFLELRVATALKQDLKDFFLTLFHEQAVISKHDEYGKDRGSRLHLHGVTRAFQVP